VCPPEGKVRGSNGGIYFSLWVCLTLSIDLLFIVLFSIYPQLYDNLEVGA
jgi:hypothetical protein